MTPYEQELLVNYLTHLNVLGDEVNYPNFDDWYREVRYAQGQRRSPNTAGGLRATLQGRPGRREVLQLAAGHQLGPNKPIKRRIVRRGEESERASDHGRATMSTPVCDCPEPCACYAEGYAQGKDKGYFEMDNFDWTQHAKGCGCEACTAFSKVLVRMLDHMATGDEEGRLVAFHFTSWLNGSLEIEKLT